MTNLPPWLWLLVVAALALAALTPLMIRSRRRRTAEHDQIAASDQDLLSRERLALAWEGPGRQAITEAATAWRRLLDDLDTLGTHRIGDFDVLWITTELERARDNGGAPTDNQRLNPTRRSLIETGCDPDELAEVTSEVGYAMRWEGWQDRWDRLIASARQEIGEVGSKIDDDLTPEDADEKQARTAAVLTSLEGIDRIDQHVREGLSPLRGQRVAQEDLHRLQAYFRDRIVSVAEERQAVTEQSSPDRLQGQSDGSP